MTMKLLVVFTMLLMLSALVFAAEEAAGAGETGHEAAAPEGGDAHAAEGGEAKHGLSLDKGSWLILAGVLGSFVVLILIYFILSKRAG